MKIFGLILTVIISGKLYAGTPQQEEAWNHFSRVSTIKNAVKGSVQRSQCSTLKNQSLESGCINATINDFLSFSTLPYAPHCNDKNILVGFKNCGPTPGQLAQIKIYSSEQIIRDRVGNGSYCNQQGVMDREMCPGARDYALETNCIEKWQYDAAVRLNYGPSCMTNTAGEFVLLGFCKCGCFSEETEIAGGDESPLNINQLLNYEGDIKTLDPDSTIDQFITSQRAINGVLIGEKVFKKMYTIKTKEGSSLTVTHDHAILTGTGDIVSAENLKTSDLLVSGAGSLVRIDEIKVSRQILNVFNIQTDAPLTDGKSHIIFANDIATGDMVWQSELSREVNSINIRQY